MTAEQYKKAIAKLGLSQGEAAKLLGVNPRTSGRWAQGACRVPVVVALFLEAKLKEAA